MGQISESYDVQISTARIGYIKALTAGNLQMAQHFVIMMNKSILPRNRVKENDGSDLKMPTFDSGGMNIRERDDVPRQMLNWCFKYEPLVEDAVSRERETMLQGIIGN